MSTVPQLLTLCLFAAALSTGCVSTTRVNSRPAQARVLLDGKKEMGKTPIELTELVWLWTNHRLHVSKNGYESRVVPIKGKFHAPYLAACVCTAGLLWPMLLLGKYDASYFVELVPAAAGATTTPGPDDAITFADASSPRSGR